MTTDPQRPEVDGPRVLALAKARQQLAYDNPFNAVCPPWDGLSEKEQHLSLLDARSYLHAAMKAGLVPAVSVPPPPPATRADVESAVWVDGDPLMEAIAAAVWEHCQTEGTMSLVVDDPRNIAAVAAAVARRMADEEQPECTASISGRCLRESQSETACDTDAGECVHGGRPADEEQPAPVAQQPAAAALSPVGGVKGNPFDYHPEDEPQPAAEAWVCKCPAGLCGCGHHAPTEQQPAADGTDEEPQS